MNEDQGISTYYDEFAPHYVPGWRSVQYYGPLVADFLLRAVTPECRVLDVGCGPGQLTSQLAEDVEVLGCDVSPQMLASARGARPSGRYELHDLHDPVPRDWGRFDVVLAVGCLEFCRDLGATLTHLAAACAPGARVLVGAVEDRTLGPGATTRAFSQEGLPGVAMHAYDATAQLAAVTASGLAPYGYRYVPGWRHEEYGYVVHYGLWELRRDR
ncbi:class I SAM-dependent methyltransferase [Kineococcus sp. NPDC059986]|jgi:2-polyprenyl-3-methyl-5-hydroxy-6-metoxy-1,4-benzoquinol methylase|uniref:class I SAM-dependent methyltransferase n=1 Tax=Kineococcus sp. NPDC059986 TaxID=3155538 RepID=UPI003450B71E